MIKENKKDCSNLEIKKFHPFILFYRMKRLNDSFDIKRIQKNSLLFEIWLIKKFSKIKMIKKGEKYNAPSMYMNEKNLNKLRDRLAPIDFLDISPTLCNSLKNNEYGIKVEEMIE